MVTRTVTRHASLVAAASSVAGSRMAVANTLLGKRQDWGAQPLQAPTLLRTQARQMNMQGGQQNMEHHIPESVAEQRTMLLLYDSSETIV